MKSFYDCLTGAGGAPENYKPAGKLSLEKAFEIYQCGYRSRLTEALGETYEKVWKVLGDELFFGTTAEFIRRTPSENYNLGEYSPAFPSFLADHPVGSEFPFLSDLARMGWIQNACFHKSQEEGLTGEGLMNLLKDENQQAHFVEHFELLHSDFCIFDLWSALSEGAEPPACWEVRQFVAFYKLKDQVFLKHLDESSYQALQKMKAGESLLSACAQVPQVKLTELFHFLAKNALLINRNF